MDTAHERQALMVLALLVSPPVGSFRWLVSPLSSLQLSEVRAQNATAASWKPNSTEHICRGALRDCNDKGVSKDMQLQSLCGGQRTRER